MKKHIPASTKIRDGLFILALFADIATMVYCGIGILTDPTPDLFQLFALSVIAAPVLIVIGKGIIK